MLEDYIAYLEIQGKSKNTIKTYSGVIKRFLKYIKKDPTSINKQDILRFLIHIKRTKNLDNNSVRLYVRAISSFLKFLGMEELTKEIQAPRVDKRLPKFITFEEFQKLVESCDKQRDKLIIKFLFYTGVRVSELCSVRVSDVLWEDGIVKVKGKGGKERIVPLPPKFVDELREFVRNKNPNDLIFNISPRHVERIVKKTKERAGIQKRITPHVLRHSLATYFLQNGVDIRYIQEILGHSSLSITQIYTHIVPSHLKNIYERVFNNNVI